MLSLVSYKILSFSLSQTGSSISGTYQKQYEQNDVKWDGMKGSVKLEK